MKINILTDLSIVPEILVVPLFQTNLEKVLQSIARDHALDADLLKNDFAAKEDEVLSTYSEKEDGAFRIFLVGLGSEKESAGQGSLKVFFIKNQKSLRGGITADLSKVPKKKAPEVARWLIEGGITGSYHLGLFKTEKKESRISSLSVFVDSESVSREIKRSTLLAETQIRTMDLVNSPANKLTPEMLGDWAVQSGKKYGYSVKALGKQEITEQGLNALLAVNQGSDLPPRLIIASYEHPEASRTVGLVGKGVTFDTGGLSIKGSANMHYMKSDMGGAAAVLGAIEVVAKLQLPVNLTVIVPATENAVDAKSVKPGDIIHSYSGKTIEVIDTDAEGRLILADALSYMIKNYSPDILIDFATLTGSIIATLDSHAAGLFTNDTDLSQKLQDSGVVCDERLWPLPLWKEYEGDLESDVADIKNYSGKPLAGAITAAKFLEAFVEEHKSWAHIDIAGTAFSDSPMGKQKHATGYGVSLMLTFLESIAESKK